MLHTKTRRDFSILINIDQNEQKLEQEHLFRLVEALALAFLYGSNRRI